MRIDVVTILGQRQAQSREHLPFSSTVDLGCCPGGGIIDDSLTKVLHGVSMFDVIWVDFGDDAR
jgi:hypothetical protein